MLEGALALLVKGTFTGDVVRLRDAPAPDLAWRYDAAVLSAEAPASLCARLKIILPDDGAAGLGWIQTGGVSWAIRINSCHDIIDLFTDWVHQPGGLDSVCRRHPSYRRAFHPLDGRADRQERV